MQRPLTILGLRIQSHLNLKLMSRQDLAVELQTNPRTVERMLTGERNVTPYMFGKIRRALNLTPLEAIELGEAYNEVQGIPTPKTVSIDWQPMMQAARKARKYNYLIRPFKS